uniref:DUF834 domain-containing protein n=1 Tax=Oryza rufipogon TaxID=4529 RepID=A0A0E0MX31_ORYRU
MERWTGVLTMAAVAGKATAQCGVDGSDDGARLNAMGGGGEREHGGEVVFWGNGGDAEVELGTALPTAQVAWRDGD